MESEVCETIGNTDKRRTIAKYAIAYTVLFAIMQELVFIWFDVYGKSFIWSADGMPNYFTPMLWIRHAMKTGRLSILPSYDFQWGAFHASTELELITALSALCPIKRMEALYRALIWIRFYAAGAAFSAMGLYFRRKPAHVLIGAMAYIYSGFGLYGGIRHPFYMLPMIAMPLLVIGTEQALKGRPAWILTATVTISLLSNLYFSCMLAVLTVLYAAIRYACHYRKTEHASIVKAFSKLVLYGGCGILLAGMTVVPSIMQNLSTGRISGTESNIMARIGMDADSGYQGPALLYQFPWFYMLALADLTVQPTDLGSWNCLGFATIAVPAIIHACSKKHGNKSLKWIVIIASAMMACPAVAYVMSGFDSVNARWSFAYALVVAAAITFAMSDIASNEKDAVATTVTAMSGFLIVYILCAATFSVLSAWTVFCILAAIAAIILAMPRTEKIRNTMLLATVCLCTVVSGYLLYGNEPNYEDNYINTFLDKGEAMTIVEHSQYAALAGATGNDGSFRSTGNNLAATELNLAPYYGVNGLTGYGSYLHIPMLEAQYAFEAAKPDGLYHRIYAPTGRAPLLTLAGVRWYAYDPNGNGPVPYGFRQAGTTNKDGSAIYENAYTIPIAYAYETYVPEFECEDLDGLAREETAMRSAILDGTPAMTTKAEPSSSTHELEYEVMADPNVTWTDGKLTVIDGPGTMTLTFTVSEGEEAYVRLTGLDDTTRTASEHKITFDASNGVKNSIGIYAKSIYDHNMENMLIPLGMFDNGTASCKITFPGPSEFELKDIQVMSRPMKWYDEAAETLQKNAMTDVTATRNTISGTITADTPEILCMAIPYETGWTAYVDGSETRIYQVNTEYMAIEITQGTHSIEFRYEVPGLDVGIAASAVGIALLATIIKAQIRKKRGDT